MQHSDLPKSRKYARRIGLKHYFTGMPCPNGHVAPRLVSCAACLECQGARNKSRRSRWECTPEYNSIPFSEEGLLKAVAGKNPGQDRIEAMITYYEAYQKETRDKYVKSYLDEVISDLNARIEAIAAGKKRFDAASSTR